MGTNKCASQAGMTAYGTRRHLYDPKTQTDKPFDQTTISLQMGTNKGASQVSVYILYEWLRIFFKEMKELFLNKCIKNVISSKFFFLRLAWQPQAPGEIFLTRK